MKQSLVTSKLSSNESVQYLDGWPSKNGKHYKQRKAYVPD